MPRPKGMDRESRADLFFLWAIVAAFAICALFALNIALTTPAKAQVAGTCKSIGELAEQVGRDYPGQRLVPLTGDSAATFMARWNSIPPRSNVVATELLILFHDRYGVTKVAMFKNGCAFTIYQIPIRSIRKLLQGLEPAKLHKTKGTIA